MLMYSLPCKENFVNIKVLCMIMATVKKIYYTGCREAKCSDKIVVYTVQYLYI